MAGANVVVLGGGVGGLVAANELRRILPDEHRVVLVEKNSEHTFAPSYLWLMTGDRQPAQVSTPLTRLLQRGIDLVVAEAEELDLDSRLVRTAKGGLNYDYLVIALGAELAPAALPGLAEASQTFYTFEGAQLLNQALEAFPGGKVALVISSLPYKCPGAPHEGAMLIADYFRRRGLREKVALHLYTPEAQPMPVAGPVLGGTITQMLAARGIEFHPSHKLTAVDAAAHQLIFEGSSPAPYDLLVAIPPHRGSSLLKQAGLTNEAGWVPVDRATLATARERVYAIGDAAAISIPGRWKPDVPLALPKAGVFAHAQARTVARRLAAEISGAEPKDVFCGDGFCMVEAGAAEAGFAFGNFFAEPAPQIELKRLGGFWHIGKVLFEQYWLAPIGLRRSSLQMLLQLGGRALGVPVAL